MAGQPILRELDNRIERLGGFEWLLEQVRDGKTYGQLALDLGCSRNLLDKWRSKRSPEEQKALRRARGNILVEEAQDIIDQADSPSAMSMAREKVRYRQWVAERVDREAWGAAPAPQVNVTLNSLHLTALQHLPTPVHNVPIEDADVLSIEAAPLSEDAPA